MGTPHSAPPVDLGDVPPTVISLEVVDPPEGRERLPWLDTMDSKALWQSAWQAVEQADTLAQRVAGDRVGRSLLFALSCELLAIGSIALALLLAVAAFYPHMVVVAVMNPGFGSQILQVAAAVVVLLSVGMVALHWLWAWAMELGARREGLPTRWAGGMTLASYACGWDLITSPLGVLLALLSHGRKSVGPIVAGALKAPRLCVLSYLEKTRGFAPEQQHRMLRFAAWLTGPIVLVFAAALLILVVLLFA
jgi:hypothetical protein